MALIYNGTTITKVIYNGTNIDTLNYGDTLVFHPMTVPTLSSSHTYSGATQSASFTNYDSSMMIIGGTYIATNAGSYTATFTPKPGYQWLDGSTTEKSVSWSIGKLSLTKPSLSDTSKTYNGSSQAPTINNYNSSWETQSGTASAADANSYTIYWSLKDTSNLQWNDGTTSTISNSWSIAQRNISGAVISLGSDLTYNGSSQTKSVSSVIVSGLSVTYSVSGNTGTNAGNYILTCTGTGNYTGSQTATWSIAKAAGTVNLSASNGIVDKNSTSTFTISGATGTVSVSSSNIDVATASISGTTVTIVGKSSGNTANIIVDIAESENYKSTSKIYVVSVYYVWTVWNCQATAAEYASSSSDTNASITYSNPYFIADSDPVNYICNAGNNNGSYSFNSSTGVYDITNGYSFSYGYCGTAQFVALIDGTNDSRTNNFSVQLLKSSTPTKMHSFKITSHNLQGYSWYPYDGTENWTSGGGFYCDVELIDNDIGSGSDGYYYNISTNTRITGNYQVYLGDGYYKHYYVSDIDGNYINFTYRQQSSYASSYTYSQGSIQYNSVSSASSTTYPANNANDDKTYWYVLQ